MKNTPPNIKLSEEEVKELLQKHLSGEHSDLMAEAILSFVPSERDRNVIFKAAMGMEPEIKFNEKDDIKFNMAELPANGYNFPAMKQANIIDENGLIDGTIIKINKWSATPYEVVFMGVGVEMKSAPIIEHLHGVSFISSD